MRLPGDPEPQFASGELVVLVEAVEVFASGEVDVTFGSPAGRCRAQCLDRKQPTVGETLLAEAEFGEALWAEDLRVVPAQPTGLFEEGGQSFLVGVVTGVEGRETTLAVETFAGAPKPLRNVIRLSGTEGPALGSCVKVRVGRIALYSTGV